jgi:hypothetical protein
LVSTTVPEYAPDIDTWSNSITYSIGNVATTVDALGLRHVYRSLVNDNLNSNPATNPSRWLYLGDTYREYDVAVTYALNEKVNDSPNHKAYISLAGSNLGNALTDVTKWLELGPTNAWAMFDTIRSTGSTTPTQQTIVLSPNARVDSVAVMGMVATDVTITVHDGVTQVYSASVTLSIRESVGWYSYFFGGFFDKPNMVKFDLPPIAQATITITVSNTAGNVTTGSVIVGMHTYIGAVQYGAQFDSLNFSTVERDFAGSVNLMVQRRNVPKTTQTLIAEKSLVNNIRLVKDALGGVPAVWSGLDDENEFFDSLLILGFYNKFLFDFSMTDHVQIILELEEI